MYPSFQGYIRYVSLLFPLIHPRKVVHLQYRTAIYRDRITSKRKHMSDCKSKWSTEMSYQYYTYVYSHEEYVCVCIYKRNTLLAPHSLVKPDRYIASVFHYDVIGWQICVYGLVNYRSTSCTFPPSFGGLYIIG